MRASRAMPAAIRAARSRFTGLRPSTAGSAAAPPRERLDQRLHRRDERRDAGAVPEDTGRHSGRDIPVTAFVALLAGALAIATSGIFVRLSETGPIARASGAARWRCRCLLGRALSSGAGARRRRAGGIAGFSGRGSSSRRSCAVALLAAAHVGRRLDARSQPDSGRRDAVRLAHLGPSSAALAGVSLALASLGVLLIVTPKLGDDGALLRRSARRRHGMLLRGIHAGDLAPAWPLRHGQVIAPDPLAFTVAAAAARPYAEDAAGHARTAGRCS